MRAARCRPEPQSLQMKETRALYSDFFDVCRRGDIKSVEEYLDRGLDVNHLHASGWSALSFAAMEENVEVCRLLIARGTKP